MPDGPGPTPPTLVPDLPAARRRRKRPDIVADRIRDLIADGALKPGDRLPGEWIRPETHDVSRGTMREALKVLEAQGLTVSKTGPGGGVFVSHVDPLAALQLLHNLFLFQPPSIAQIYAIRKLLEPQLAASLAGRLSPEAFAGLSDRVRLYEEEPRTAEEKYRQHMAGLDFHVELARLCPDRLLGFLCSFLVSLLRDIAVFDPGEPSSFAAAQESGFHGQIRLLRAIKRGHADEAGAVMQEYLATAERFMVEHAERRRVPDDQASGTASG